MIRRLARDTILALAFWLTAALLVSWQLYRERLQEGLPALYSDFLLVYAVRYTSVALLTPPIFYLARRWPLAGRSIRRLVLYVLGYPLFCCIFALIRWTLLPPWMHETLSWGPRSLENLGRLAYDTFADLFLLYAGLLCAAHAYVYFVRNRQQEVASVEMRQHLIQSELQTLRAQLHPHFLFNTLQGISSLIETTPQDAQRLLEALAYLLRTVLKHRSADFIPLSEEVRILEAYLSIEMMRLGPRLRVHWDVAPEAYCALVPQLLLQPLVENAIVHGISCAREGGWLTVEARLRGDLLHLVISNSVAGRSTPGLGLALRNLRARLRYLYGDAARFEFGLDTRLGTARAALDLTARPPATHPAGGALPKRTEQPCAL